MRSVILILLLLSSFCREGTAQQIPIGQWRQHPSYRDTRICEAANEYIYAASSKGFYQVQISNGFVRRLSAEDGFHGKTITALEYNPILKTMVIGYADGFLELLKNEKDIEEIPGFYNKLLQGDKSIQHVSFVGNYAHISTNFGILVLDLLKVEIKDSYSSIAPGGQNQQVYSTAIAGDSIYAGIPDGLLAARYNPSVNLNDHNNWKKVYQGKPVFQLTAFNDSLFFYSDTVVNAYKSGMVSEYFTQGKAFVRRIKVYDNDLCVFRPGAISRIKTNGSKTVTNLNVLQNGTFDKDGFAWFTTGTGAGMIKITPNGELSFEPNGPSNNSVFAMTQAGELLFTTAGGVTNTFGNAFNDAGFYFYENFKWRSNPISVFNSELYDFTFVSHNPINNKYYIATHTNGLLEFTGNEATNKYNENNSPLKRDIGSGFIRVSGLAADAKGMMWVANFGSSTPLLTLNLNGAWKAVSSNVLTEPNVKSLVIDANGYKWMIVQSGGVMVFDDNETPDNPNDDRAVKISTSNGLITNDVISLAADRNGYVWIGTTQGLNVVTNTFGVFDKPKADRFIIEQDGNTGYLLGEESINSICVDGGNRKWFGTNNGVFEVEPNGQKVMFNFRANNSPLPDDKIYCIGQIGSTGEMFFGTESGIASYRNDASESTDVFGNIKIYPNPVKPGYTGMVTIEGLATDAEIRITDATGVLIYKANANGGTATWPCTRLDGSRPNSGVFFVFGVNTDGTETAMGKFVFIR